MREGTKKKKAVIWVLVILLCLEAGIFFFTWDREPVVETKEPKEAASVLIDAQIHPYKTAEILEFSDKDENIANPMENTSDSKILLFWASWCPYCKEGISKINTLKAAAEGRGAQFFFVDKLDGEKETKEQALSYLAEEQVEAPLFFDEGCRVYESLGMRMIPTLIVLDHRGRVISLSEGSLPSEKKLTYMLEEAQIGKADFLYQKIEDHLVEDGISMRTNYKAETETIPSGEDVLSESMGILLEYAAKKGDFTQVSKMWEDISSFRYKEGLMPWVVSQKDEINVNALIDDLRILGALYDAKELGGEFEEAIRDYGDAIYKYNVENNQPVDIYDVKTKKKATRFTLCYGDLQTLLKLKEEDKRFQKVYSHTLELIEKGRISEKFPLYYSYYDYSKEKYMGQEFHTAEALTTLLHLSEVGKLPGEALDWIAEELKEGSVYAAYDVKGNPTKDGYYESTAVYALITMIALNEGREDLAGEAIYRMEQFRVSGEESVLYGLFGKEDGSSIYSFDQGMALLAYQLYERKTD